MLLIENDQVIAENPVNHARAQFLREFRDGLSGWYDDEENKVLRCFRLFQLYGYSLSQIGTLVAVGDHQYGEMGLAYSQRRGFTIKPVMPECDGMRPSNVRPNDSARTPPIRSPRPRRIHPSHPDGPRQSGLSIPDRILATAAYLVLS